MKGGFEIVDHTADVGLRVWGKNWRELFEEAARGMVSLIIDLKTVRRKEEKTLSIQGENAEELLLRWLREILFLMEQGRMVFNEFQVEKDNFDRTFRDAYSFEGMLRGEKIDATRHGICTEIKAVTRHDLHVVKNDSWWEASILFDV